MSKGYRKLWASVPKRADHEVRVAMIEALWWTEESISPIRFVDVFDGQLGSQWELRHHLEVLRKFGVVKAVRDETEEPMVAGNERCYVRYRLSILAAD